MNDIRLNGRLIFESRNYDEVAEICEKNASDARGHGGMPEYSFWVNEDHTEIYIHEHYADADSFVNHMQNMDEIAVGRLLELIQLGTMECCVGQDPDPRVTEILSQYGTTINNYTLVARR